jgi:phosphoribosyl 1,2-cyclic phosphate phosphodiesterase
MFTFLGTSAGEQYPGVWCDCQNCHGARHLGGVNRRRNSCAILADHTLIDFGPAIPIQLDERGFSLLKVDTLLVTHSHQDHFFPWYLRWRYYPRGIANPPEGHEMGPVFTKPLPLTIYGNSRVRKLTWDAIKGDPQNHHLDFVLLRPWESVVTRHLVCTPIKANHDPREECFNFILEYQGKTILYATDTAAFLPQTKEFLTDYRFDLVVMEGTLGFNQKYDASVSGHSNFHLNRETREWMLSSNMLAEKAPFVITHTGPHFAPPHEECAPLLAKWQLTLAHDGMTVHLQKQV